MVLLLQITLFLCCICLVIDWCQTAYIANHPDKFFETNVLLGKHPSVLEVSIYFVIWIIAVILLSYAAIYYNVVECALILNVFLYVIEMLCIVHNHSIGIPLDSIHITRTHEEHEGF